MFSKKETQKFCRHRYFSQSHTSTCTFASGDVTKVSADKNLGPGLRKRSGFLKKGCSRRGSKHSKKRLHPIIGWNV